MTSLELPDGGLAGIVAWNSVLHTPPAALPVVFAAGDLRRVRAAADRGRAAAAGVPGS
jgi:hypothetical protein